MTMPSKSCKLPSRVARVAGGFLSVVVACCLALPVSAADARVIYMVIQADPKTTKGEVKDKFHQALNGLVGCNVREVLVEPIDPQTFTILRSVLQRGLGAIQEKPAGGAAESIKPLVGTDSAWSIDLGGPFEFIEGVTVAVPTQAGEGDAAEDRPVQVTGPGPNPDGYALRLHSPGRYVLTLPKDVTPRSVSFEVIVDDGQNDVTKRRVEQAWPSVGRAYLVTLSDVVGQESLLFQSLQDPKKVANPIRGIQDATKASLMVASFVEVLGTRLRIQGGQITFSFPKPANVSPKRLWLLFPLTTRELEENKKKLLEELAKEDGFMRLPEIIRRDAAKDPLAPGRGARWVELPLVGNEFTGVIDLDLDAWKAKLAGSADSVGDNALLVHEFDDGAGTLRAINMEPGGYVVTDRIAEWLPALRGAE